PGQRIHLADANAPVGQEAQIDPGDVAASERHERALAGALDRAKLVFREPRRALVADVLLPVLLALVVVDRPLVLREKDDLHRRQDARPSLAEETHGELAAEDVLFDQRRLAVPLDELARYLAQARLAVADALAGDALARPLLIGFDDDGIPERPEL